MFQLESVTNRSVFYSKIFHYYLYSFTMVYKTITLFINIQSLPLIFVLPHRPLFILCKRKCIYNLFMEVFSKLSYNINHNE